jgi:hypothetical protein
MEVKFTPNNDSAPPWCRSNELYDEECLRVHFGLHMMCQFCIAIHSLVSKAFLHYGVGRDELLLACRKEVVSPGGCLNVVGISLSFCAILTNEYSKECGSSVVAL